MVVWPIYLILLFMFRYSHSSTTLRHQCKRHPSMKSLFYRGAFVYGIFNLLVITISTVLFCLQSLPAYYRESNGDVKWDVWFISDTIIVIIFTFDYICHVGSAPKRWRFFFTPGALIDLLAIFPYYLEFLLRGGTFASVAVIRVIRLTRLFRLFKLSKFHNGLSLVQRTLKNSSNVLILLLFLAVLATVFFSSMLYFAETWNCHFDHDIGMWVYNNGQLDPEDDATISDFTSIPATMWYTIVTMTTTGYGDVTPKTTLGRILGSICMIAGIMVLAFPVSVLGTNFSKVWDDNDRHTTSMQMPKHADDDRHTTSMQIPMSDIVPVNDLPGNTM